MLASVNTALGDKGNPKVTKELDALGKACYVKLPKQFKISLGDCPSRTLPHFSLTTESGDVEKLISASLNVALGDKGNPQVTEELDALGKGNSTNLSFSTFFFFLLMWFCL